MYKRITNGLIRQCINGLELLKWERGFEKFHIEECFNLHGLKSFEVTNLSADFEDGVIFCWDDKDKLYSMDCVSVGFLIKNIKSVDVNLINDIEYDQINFNDGYIKINAVK